MRGSDHHQIYTEWTMSAGHRTMKRPGVDFFLDWARKNFGEVVLFTDDDITDAQPLVMKLDKDAPDGYFLHRLWKTDLRSRDGKLVKDVSVLNRDPSRVIFLDDDADRFAANPENGLRIPPFEGDRTDTALIDLIPFLQHLVQSKSDVRQVLPRYHGVTDVGLAYKAALAEKWERQAAMGAVPKPATSPAPTSPTGDTTPPKSSAGGYEVFGVRLW